MVAVVTNNGLGLFNASNNVLGALGLWGQGMLGQAGGRSYVNAATGNLVLQFRDEQLSGRGSDLQHLRTYNSQGQITDGDDDGWRWDGERTVVLSAGTLNQAGSKVTRTDGDGHATEYTWDGTRYVSTEGSGAHDVLRREQTQWIWTDGTTRVEERYTDSTGPSMIGRLVSRSDVTGNVITFEYAGARLAAINDVGSGQRLELTYATVPGTTLTRLSKVSTKSLSGPNGTLGAAVKEVDYGYDTQGRLTSVTTDLTPAVTSDALLYVTSYTYQDASNRVLSITQSDGTSVSFTYEQNAGVYRVKTVTDASGKQTFVYNASSTDVEITDPAGNNKQTWTFTYDSAQRLKKIESPAPTPGAARLATTFDYDLTAGRTGDLLQVTDARGKRVIYRYDERGNRRLERDELGNTVLRTFDANNQVLTETRYTGVDSKLIDLDETGTISGTALTTRYVYDNKSRLRFAITPEGRVSESRYNGNGLLERTVQYTTARYSGTQFSETDLASWVMGLSDKSQVQLTQYSYDLRGNLAQRTAYAKADATGAGVLDAATSITEYTYDGYGALLQSLVKVGAARNSVIQLTSFAYDGLGRELSRTSGGNAYVTVYDDANRRIQVGSTGTGLVETRTFDTVGRLTSVSQSAANLAARETRYFYDAQGRQVMTLDALGGKRFSFYDAAGWLEFTVDATGAVCQYVYDANGRQVAQTHYDARIATAALNAWIDVDNAGNPLRVNRTTLLVGTDVQVTASKDRTSRFTYDDAGRLQESEDAARVKTVFTYDGASRMTQQQTADRVTQYFFDADGRQVGVLDPLGFLTENKYDAAGRLTEAIRYATRSPAASNRSAPEWIGVPDQVSATGGKPFAYRMQAVDADGDPLTYSLKSVVPSTPAWLTLDTSVAGFPTLKGTPPATLTSYIVTVEAADGRGRTTPATLRINTTNSAPNWVRLEDRTVRANTSNFSLILPEASDNETAAAQLVYSIQPSLSVPGLSFDAASRTISGKPTVPGTYVITARVADGTGSQALFTERSFVLQVAQGPTWPAPPPQPQLFKGVAFNYVLAPAVDPEGRALTYAVVDKPSWLEVSFAGGTVTLSGSPGLPGSYPVVLEARDAQGEAIRLSFNLVVSNSWPTWGGGSSDLGTVPRNRVTTLTLPAAIDPDGEPGLVYSLEGSVPSGISVTTTDLFGISVPVLSVRLAQEGRAAVTLRATDRHGGFVERLFTFNIVNSSPTFMGGIYDQPFGYILTIGKTDAQRTLQVEFPKSSFQDPNGDALTFTVSGNTGVSFSQNGNGLQFTRIVPANEKIIFSRNITVTARDPAGAGASVTFNFSYQSVWQMPEENGLVAASGDVEIVDAAAPVAEAAAPVDVLASLRPATSTVDRHSYFFYDGQARMAGSVDEQGFLSETIYDEAANKRFNIRYENFVTVGPTDTLATLKVRADAAKRQVVTTELDAQGRVARRIDVDGTATLFEYDRADRLVREVRGEGLTEQRAQRTRYNAFGEVTGTVGGKGDASGLEVDAAITQFGMRHEYDSLGRRTRSLAKDALGNDQVTLYYYDSENQLTHTVNALGDVTETTYNAFGQVEEQRRYDRRLPNTAEKPLLDQLKAGTKGRADLVAELGLAIYRNNAPEITKYEYDQRGLLAQSFDAEGFATLNSYDVFGRLEAQTRTIRKAVAGVVAKTTTTRYAYDLRGALLAQTQDAGGLNFMQRTVYDAFGRVVQSIDPAGRVTRTDYQDSGRAIEVTLDPDGLNRKVRTVYDAFARVLRYIDADNRQTTYEYNHTARSFRVTTPEGISVLTTKTRFGETLTVTTGLGPTDTVGRTTTYEYDKDGQLTKVTDPLQQVVTENQYTDTGLLARTVSGGVVTTLKYDALNRVIERCTDPTEGAHIGLNLQTQYEFNVLGRQARVIQAQSNGKLLITNLGYDRNGRLIESIVEKGGLNLTTRYGYDGLGNNIQVSQGTQTEPLQRVTQYVFDELQRRVKEIAVPSAIFGAGSARERDLTTEFRYDAAGRMSRRIDANGASTWYAYNSAGELTHTLNAEGEVSESVYDRNGRVVQTRLYVTRIDTAALGDVVSSVPVTPTDADQRSVYVFDKDGRQRYLLRAMFVGSNGKWTISESIYAAKSNTVIETRNYDRFIVNTRITALEVGGVTADEVAAELVTLGYDPNVPATLGNVRRTRFAYDQNDRLRFTVDATGSVSESVYDIGGRVLKTVRYAERPSLTAFDEASINAKVNRNEPRNQVDVVAYDDAGRVRFTLRVLASDAQGVPTQHLVSEQTLDGMGRVVMTTAYAATLGAVGGDYSAANIAQLLKAQADPAADRRTVAVYDTGGRQIYSVQVAGVNAQGERLHLVTKLEYDALGQIVKRTAYATPVLLLNYRQAQLDAGVIASAQDRVTRYAYDKAGRPRFTVAADGSFSETLYDAAGRVIEMRRFPMTVKADLPITDADLSAYRVTRRVGDGVTRGEKYTYDRVGRVLTTTDALGAIESNQYDALGNRTRTIDKNGAQTDYVYDRLGRMVSIDLPQVSLQLADSSVVNARLQTIMEYDALGNLVRRVAGNGRPEARSTRFAYDLLGRQRFAVAADGSFSETVYDALGQVSESRQFAIQVDPDRVWLESALISHRSNRSVGDGVTRGEKYTYDAAGRRKTVTDAGNFTETSEYNTFGERIRRVDKNGNTWSCTYDTLGRLRTEVSPPVTIKISTAAAAARQSLTTRYEYDAFGDLTARTEADGTDDARAMRFEYDALGRQTKVTQPGWYDPATGRVERSFVLGRFERTTETSYDALGNVQRVSISSAIGTYLHEYKVHDALGRVLYDVDVLGQVTRFTYRPTGEQATITRYNTTLTGRPVNQQSWTAEEIDSIVGTDPAARMVSMSYDALGRKTEARLQAAPSYFFASTVALVNAATVTPVTAEAVTRYDYNIFGELRRESVQLDTLTSQDSRGGHWRDTWHYYDVRGREFATIDALGHRTARRFDANGNLIESIEYANAGALGSFAVTPPAVPTASTSGRSNRDRILAFAYNALNQQTGVVRKNFSHVSFEGGSYVEKNIGSGAADGVTVMAMTYDGMGRVRTQTDASGRLVRTDYNELGQVAKITEPARLSAMGNVDPFLNQVNVAPVTSILFNAFGQEVQRVRSSRLDAQGQADVTATDARITQQAYDFGGNLVSSTDANGNSKSFAYDYAGRLTQERQAINVTLRGGIAGGTWQTVSHSIERRYAYDASGHRTDVLDVYFDDTTGLSMQSGVRVLYNAFGEKSQELKVWGAASSPLGILFANRVASYEYDQAGRLATQLAVDGTTRYFYDLAGQMTRQEQLGNGETYDDTGTRVTETGRDLLGRSIIVRAPVFIPGADTHQVYNITPFAESTYDRWGNVLSSNRKGAVLNYYGVLTPEQRAALALLTTTFEYNADNQVVAEHAPAVTAVRADGSSYRSKLTHAWDYDLDGRMLQERELADDAATVADEALLLRSRTKEFDAIGQLKKETDGTGVTTEYAYDSNGNRVGTRNALGTVMVSSFDRNGNVVSQGVLRQAGGVNPYFSGSGVTPVVRTLRFYQYDQANRRIGSADVMNTLETVHLWTMTQYDERGLARAIRPTWRSTNTWTYRYDQFGNKVYQADGNGQVTTWEYNSFDDYRIGRLEKRVAGNRRTSYVYTDFGQLKSESTRPLSGNEFSSSRSYEYEQNGLVASVGESFSKGISGGEIADFEGNVDVTSYDYTSDGQISRQVFTHTASRDVSGKDGVRLVTDAPITRTTFLTYDELGRLATFSTPFAINPDRDHTIESLSYSYDEFGNRRKVAATFERNAGAENHEDWFTYDREGRMLVVNGVLANGGIVADKGNNSTTITYDALGRRSMTEQFGGVDVYTAGPAGGTRKEVTFDKYWSERFEYDDLDRLSASKQRLALRNIVEKTIRQIEGRPEIEVTHPPDEAPGTWHDLESRTYDVRGNLTNRLLYRRITLAPESRVQVVPTLESTTTFEYHDEGTLKIQSTVAHGDARNSSTVTNRYDSAGNLTQYTAVRGLGTDAESRDRYDYTYNTDFGGYKVASITVVPLSGERSGGSTVNTFDERGQIAKQTVTNSVETRVLTFEYDAEGRATKKTEAITPIGGTTRRGEQRFFYAEGQLATLGTGSLNEARFENGYAAITADTGTASRQYAVGPRDTLAGIAQTVYGDAQLWYLIAEANSLGFGPAEELPSTELGRTYRIPDIVTNRNNASTFTPYDPSANIGLQMPGTVQLPGCDWVGLGIQAIRISVNIAVSMLVGYYAGPAVGGFAGGFAGSLAGQSAAILAGRQDSIDWNDAMFSAMEGAASGMIAGAFGEIAGVATSGWPKASSDLFKAGVAATGQELWRQGRTGFKDWDFSSWEGVGKGLAGSMTNIAVGTATSAVGSRWQGELLQMANNALNPNTGWLFNERSRDWNSIASQAVGSVANVVVGGATDWVIDRLRTRRMENIAQQLAAAAVGGGAAGLRQTVMLDPSQTYDLEALKIQYGDGTFFVTGASGANEGLFGRPRLDMAQLPGFASGLSLQAPKVFGIPTDGLELRADMEHVSTKAEKTLEDVAEQYYGRHYRWLATAIAVANDVDPLLFKPGMKLTIPAFDNLDLDAAWGLRMASNKRENSVIDERNWQKGQAALEREQARFTLDAEYAALEAAKAQARAYHLRVDDIDSDALVSFRPGYGAELRNQLVLQQLNQQEESLRTQAKLAYQRYYNDALQFAKIRDVRVESVLDGTYEKSTSGVLNTLNTILAEPFAQMSDAIAGAHESRLYPDHYVYYSQYGMSLQEDYERNLGFSREAYLKIATQVAGSALGFTPAGYARYAAAAGTSLALAGPLSDMVVNGVNASNATELGANLLMMGSTHVAMKNYGNLNLGFAPRETAAISPPIAVSDTPLTANRVGPANAGGSSSYYPTRQGVLNALWSAGTNHARGIADAINMGRLTLTIHPSSPTGRSWRGSYTDGSGELVLYADAFSSDVQAAGTAAHEGVHWLQDRGGLLGRNYHYGHEFEAFLSQRLVDPTHWANRLSDSALLSKVKQLYGKPSGGSPAVPRPPAGWTPIRY